MQKKSMVTKESLIEALRTVFDPEIPINVWDLGLIYDLHTNDNGKVTVKFTMTSPTCPFAGILKADLEAKIKAVAGVSAVELQLTFNPHWNPEKMTPEGKAMMELGM